jgi:hypothetical protein
VNGFLRSISPFVEDPEAMWTTLALAAALGGTVAQAPTLTLTNVRATYGLLGAERQDNKVLPGDRYYIAFDIDGVEVDKEGKVRYSMGMEVKDSQGKVVYASKPRDMEAFNSLGGSRMQAFVNVDAGFSQPAGEYTVTVTVSDLVKKATQTLVRKIQILPKDFGLARLACSFDQDGRLAAPPQGVTGQSLFVSFYAVGFERDSTKKQPNVAAEMRILDENGKPVLPNPFAGEVSQDVPENVVALPMSFVLFLNRPGRFTVELQGTDRISKKTSRLSFPLIVTEQKAAGGSDQR